MDGIDPDFLLKANKLLHEGNPREAAELCTRGLVKYPEYNTAYLILLYALAEMGDKIQMEEVYESAPHKVRNNPRVVQLMEIAEQSEEPQETESNTLEDDINQAIRNDEISPELLSNLTKESIGDQEIDIKETLTLAKIYEQQDAYAEALAIYKQLQSISEDKSLYQDKILELETFLEDE